MQAFRIAPPLHHAAGEFVDDDDLVVSHDVFGVARKQFVRPQRLIDVMNQRDIVDVVQAVGFKQAALAQHRLDLFLAGFGQRDGLLLFVLLVIIGIEGGDQLVDRDVEFGIVFGRAGDDQGRARLVDQDRIDLVDDRVVERSLHHLFEPELHVVAQIIEAQFVVGAVCHIAAIGLLALVIVEFVDDAADAHAEKAINLPHPFGIALGEVVVDGHDMRAVAGQRVEVHRQRRHQRLAFARLHLGDHAAMQDDAAHQLHVEMPLPQSALCRLAHGRKGFDEEVVEFGALVEPLAKLGGAGAQRVVRQLFERRLQFVDLLDDRPEPFEVAVVGGAEQPPG